MPYLPTPQAYLEQSALLLQAYPDSRITTKYSFPSQRPTALKKAQARQKQQQQEQQQEQTQDDFTTQSQSTAATTTTPAPPVATLTLKTYNPSAGICLQYRTNKAAEVGRLITSLGKLAAGADVAALGLGPAPAAAGAPVGDVEMADAPVTEEGSAAQPPAAAQGKADGAKGGKSKKKGKGKR